MKIINNFPKLTKLDNIENELTDKAPIDHSSTTTTYGAGSVTNYGHVKLSDSYTSSEGAASASVAASSKAVADAYAEINSNLFKTKDYNIQLSNLSWIDEGVKMKWAYYDISSLNATKVLSVSILGWGWWKNTDYINVGIGEHTPNSILIISNTTSFLDNDANITVRVHYV